MKKTIITTIFLSCLMSVKASPITERFTDDYDLKPYITWIANNTRFVNAANVKNIELPLFYLLNTIEYKRTISLPSLAAYSPERNIVFVDQDRVQGQPDIILHELIHFYQHRDNPNMSSEMQEKEAYAIQRKFVSAK